MNLVELDAKERRVPDIFTFNNGSAVKSIRDFERRREEIRELLLEYEYGKIPSRPDHFSVTVTDTDKSFSAGKATLLTLKITVEIGNASFSFPLYSVIPNAPGKHPAFIHINFTPNVPDRYMPSEEIVDRGYATFSFCYNDVTLDNDNFCDGLARIFIPSKRVGNTPGKISLWAWAAMRVMDYVETLDEIDTENVAVIGHSCLGKTALLAGAFDERFKYVISNDSGCSGAAILRKKTGENLAILASARHYWFCPNYVKYTMREEELPLDQHFLLAACAPRHILIGTAEEDAWADPESEFISAHLAGEVYEKIYKLPGLRHDGKIPRARCVLDGGNISYHIRAGGHYLSREDWNIYMDYIDKQMKK